MPGPAHEVPLGVLTENPEHLSALLELAGRRRLPRDARIQDSAVRPEPVAPDLALGAEAGAVTLLELQLDPDERKRLRWPLAVAQVSDARREMCDLVVLTPFEAVARWASRIRLVGPLGTRLVLHPVVVHVDDAMIEAILAGPPDLAFFAAWAVSHRYGKRATQVVYRALARNVELPGDQRDRQESAILAMMNPRLAATLKEAKMNSDPFLTPQAIELRQVLRAWEARGAAQALLTVLAARGLAVDDDARARIEACTDRARLDQWVARAITADRVEDVLGEP